METSWQYFIFGKEREAMLQPFESNERTKFHKGEVTLSVYDHLAALLPSAVGNTRIIYKLQTMQPSPKRNKNYG